MMNHRDSGRLGKFAIDQRQMFHNVCRNTKHRQMKLALFGCQSKQLLNLELRCGCGLNSFDMEMRSTRQQHEKQPHRRSTRKGAAMDQLANLIEELPFESPSDDKIDAGDV